MSHQTVFASLSQAPPAGGASLVEVAIGLAVGTAGLLLVALVSRAYRRGGARWLRWTGRVAERISGLPAWACLPVAVCGGSLLVAVVGFYWDVATHIDAGRDDGPFANPAHYLIFAGLVGIASAGWLAALVADGERPGGAVRLGRDRWVPLGGALILLCGGVALAAFPLDDLWHRLFGQDVTLWGPTHVLMVGGASLSTLGMWVLWTEGQAVGAVPERRRASVARREALLAGAFLLGLSTLQGEFDFGVPQFRLLYHPVLVVLAASIGLVAARVRLGPWGAVKTAVMFIVVRGALTLLIGPGLGRITLHFPLYLAEALLVEFLVRRRLPRPGVGATAGAAIGSIGLAAEWGWSHLWMPIPWPAELLPEAAILGLAAGVAGGVVGELIGRALSGEPLRARRGTGIAALAVVAAALVYPAPVRVGYPVVADVRLTETGPDQAVVRVSLSPADAARDAIWFHVLAWQGLEGTRGTSRLVPMVEAADGDYRTEEPVPTGGQWKTILRLHVDDRLLALPIHLPTDRGIPAPEVRAQPRAERTFGPDKAIVQREAVTTSVGLQRVAYSVLLAVAVAWIAALALGLARLGRRARTEPPDGIPRPPASAASLPSAVRR